MQCRSVEERLQELLDDRLDPSCDFELIEHAEGCAECRDLLEAQDALFAGLARLPVPSLSPDFSQRVVGTVVLERKPDRRFAPAAALLAVIATLLLAVALGPPRHPGVRPAGQQDGLAGAHSAGGGALALAMADFDSLEVRIAFEQFVAQLTSGEGAGFYQVDQIAGTIRPLASTLNVAFDAIRRSIPGRRHPAQVEPQARGLRAPSAVGVI